MIPRLHVQLAESYRFPDKLSWSITLGRVLRGWEPKELQISYVIIYKDRLISGMNEDLYI